MRYDAEKCYKVGINPDFISFQVSNWQSHPNDSEIYVCVRIRQEEIGTFKGVSLKFKLELVLGVVWQTIVSPVYGYTSVQLLGFANRPLFLGPLFTYWVSAFATATVKFRFQTADESNVDWVEQLWSISQRHSPPILQWGALLAAWPMRPVWGGRAIDNWCWDARTISTGTLVFEQVGMRESKSITIYQHLSVSLSYQHMKRNKVFFIF